MTAGQIRTLAGRVDEALPPPPPEEKLVWILRPDAGPEERAQADAWAAGRPGRKVIQMVYGREVTK
jgi:hypothetical protein